MDYLLNEINRNFSIKAVSIQPRGTVWKLSSAAGFFMLKRMRRQPEELHHLAKTLESLLGHGFAGLAQFIRSFDQNPFILWKSRPYVLSKWYSGENPSFTNPADLRKTAALYGRLHATAQGLTQSEETPKDFISVIAAKTTFLRKVLTELPAVSKKNRIDRAILKWGRYFLDQAELSVADLMQKSDRIGINLKIGFCHKDPAPRNIIIQKDSWVLIDFELSGIDPFVVELATLLHRTLALNGWNREIFSLIIDAYQTERGLTGEENWILPRLLCFPRQFWRFCSQRFLERLKWTERHFQSRWWNLIAQEEQRVNFLKNWFPELQEWKWEASYAGFSESECSRDYQPLGFNRRPLAQN